ncbi:MAG: DUF362 domain-containing protein [Deltaproteobacteria bacterium]|nr:DUF362 domain-containing protein [Deltaproteobacteria bacterium]
MHRVMIQPADYQNCLAAVKTAFELFPMNVRGNKVLVKPNVLRASEPAEAVTTNPVVLRAVVQCLEDMNPAKIIVGDNPGLMNYGANEASFRQTGLYEASLGHYQNIGLDAAEVSFNPEYVSHLSVSRAVLEADVIISLPKFKTHGLTILTGAIKNSYGILPGAQKALLHKLAGTPVRFQEVIVDVFQLRIPDLFIVDAVIGMEGNGPASPDLRSIGQILASDNAVALDAVISRMMGLDPGLLRFLQKAKALGLGDYDEAAIEIIGELTPIPNFKLPPLSGEAITQSTVIQELIHSRTLLRPWVDPNMCSGCGTCSEQCPASAISMEDGYPHVNYYNCITCFCCQEMCPEKAITLK